jgi:hypothetical protein
MSPSIAKQSFNPQFILLVTSFFYYSKFFILGRVLYTTAEVHDNVSIETDGDV